MNTLLASLPETNLFHRADLDGTLRAHLAADPHELVDLLLNERERSYSVPQLYELLDEAGLDLASFTSFFLAGGTNKTFYRPDSYIQEPELLARFHSLPLRKQHAACEILHGNITLHSLYACKDKSSVATGQSDTLCPYFFVRPAEDLCAILDSHPDQPLRLADSYGNALDITAQPALTRMIGHLQSGNNSVADIARDLATQAPFAGQAHAYPIARAAVLNVIDLLGRFDWVLLRDRPVFGPFEHDQEATLTLTPIIPP